MPQTRSKGVKDDSDASASEVKIAENTGNPEEACASATPKLGPSYLVEIFPDVCPKYIKSLCKNRPMNDETLDGIITVILEARNAYPKRPPPGSKPPPAAQLKQYTKDFSVENFLKVIPDPVAFFSDPAREQPDLNFQDLNYFVTFMGNKFDRLGLRTIRLVSEDNHYNIAKVVEELEAATGRDDELLKHKRKMIRLPASGNVPLLQELAYYEHKEEIQAYFSQQKEMEAAEREDARQRGLLKTCPCCCDDEVLPGHIYTCEKGCEICKGCISKGAEVNFGDGKSALSCVMNCNATYTLQTLQAVLAPKFFSKVAEKKALEEVKAAGIEDLEMCPFCGFATIPAEGYTTFTCLNPECMKESCRLCKKASHIPLRCEELENDADVRVRTYLENKMTEALLKKCYKCGVEFFKEEGCNRMTCPCGAQMCYLCGQPVNSYDHFNRPGDDRYDLCPLFSDNSLLNKENVLRGVEEAKAKMGNVPLKYDPTVDVEKHYEERRRMFPPRPAVNVLHRGHFHGVMP